MVQWKKSQNPSTFSFFLSFLSFCISFYVSICLNHKIIEFQEWWNKQRENHHDLFIKKSETQRLFIFVEIHTLSADPVVDKEQTWSANQFSWVCLLRLQAWWLSLLFLLGMLAYVYGELSKELLNDGAKVWVLFLFPCILYSYPSGSAFLCHWHSWGDSWERNLSLFNTPTFCRSCNSS